MIVQKYLMMWIIYKCIWYRSGMSWTNNVGDVCQTCLEL